MSAAQSQLDVKPLPAQLCFDLSHTPSTRSGLEHDSTIHAFPVEHSNEAFGTDTIHHHSDTTQFDGDYSFQFQSHQGEPPLGSLLEEHGPQLFSNPQRQPTSSSMADIKPSAPSITAHVAGFGGTGSSRGRSSMDGSDEDSPASHPHRASLDDPLSDEFGLTSTGPGDGTDLGGKPKEDKTDTAPPWSELKTKAGKERKRLPLACIACRRKKIRCSGEKPACKHCLRSRIPCVYKVTARKAAPRTDYMAMLDKRLKRMEERIIKIVPKNEQDGISSSVPRANVKPAIPGTLPSGKGGARKRGAEEAFGGPDLDSWAKAPVKTNLESPTQANALLMVNETEESKLLQEGLEALPSKEIQEHLADVFFESVYGQAYHILHKPSYMRKLRAGALPPVLILSVCAMSARFSSHPKLKSEPAFLRGEEWAAIAREIVTKRYEWPNITILTCLLILGLHEFATCHGGRSWSLGGQAIRMAFALQLHKDLDYDPMRPGVQLSFVDREIRRRTMWACFLMDRFNSSGTERPTFIKEETLKIPLPVKEKNFQLDMPAPTENLQGEVLGPLMPEEGGQVDAKENMGVAAYMVKAISIWGRVINHLNQGGRDMDIKEMWDNESEYMRLIKEAEDLANSLPESLVYNPDNLHLHDTESMANQFVFLHIAVQQNILFLNRFAVSSPNPSSLQDIPKSFVTKAGAKAFGAANRISELLKDSESYFIAAPFVGYCAFLSSTVHIFGIFSGNATIEASSKRNLAINVKFLSKMKRFWGMFHFMTENLREQYRTCADAARRGNLSNDASASPIFQYGDWFDRYPHGVSQSDFVDPAIYKKKEKGDDAVLEQKPELHTVEEFFTAMSPQHKDGSGRSNSMSIKRKALAAKRGSINLGRGDHHGANHQLEPLMTDLSPEQIARLQQQGRYPSVTLGGQTSGAASFGDLSAVQHPGAYNTTLSPISPVAVSHSQFGGHHNPHGLYTHDMLSISLAQNGMLPHSMLGPYSGGGIDPTTAAAMMDGIPGWEGPENGAGNGREARTGGGGGGPGGGADGSHNNPHHTVFGHGHDANAAWFMPFNMDPPEVGDVGGLASGIDGFGSMFGAAGNGRGGVGGAGTH